jgi:hypothetical protein
VAEQELRVADPRVAGDVVPICVPHQVRMDVRVDAGALPNVMTSFLSAWLDDRRRFKSALRGAGCRRSAGGAA